MFGNKKGPENAGEKTGRGLGFCSGNEQAGYLSDQPRQGMGRGMGRGRGRMMNQETMDQMRNQQRPMGQGFGMGRGFRMGRGMGMGRGFGMANQSRQGMKRGMGYYPAQGMNGAPVNMGAAPIQDPSTKTEDKGDKK